MEDDVIAAIFGKVCRAFMPMGVGAGCRVKCRVRIEKRKSLVGDGGEGICGPFGFLFFGVRDHFAWKCT